MAGRWSVRIDTWSLRRRVLASVLLLSTIGLIAAGLLTTAALRSYLQREVDQRLIQSTRMLSEGEVGRPPPWLVGGGGDPGPSAFYTRISDATGTRHTVVTTPAEDAATPPHLPEMTYAEVEEIEGQPFTATSDGPDWRVIAWTLPDASGTVMVAASLGSVQDTVSQLVALQIAIGLAILVAIAVVGRWLVVRGLQPLTVVQQTASAIADGRLDERVPPGDPATEVGALGAAFNTMLDRLQASFDAQAASEAAARGSEERMRRFVADASHELRTPLTTVRGFAELHRMGALESPDATADAMRRIETESARMGVLVADLLLLARMDQERALAMRDVDLVAVAADAVAAASAAWPKQEFALLANPERLLVTGDADRLYQVLTNLLSNAQRFNTAGQPIEVSVTASGEAALLSVADRGPGVPPELREHIFERFVRADDSRSRPEGGAGLGLSIVSAIVGGHNGRVTVEDRPGGGASFLVRLPLPQTGQ